MATASDLGFLLNAPRTNPFDSRLPFHFLFASFVCVSACRSVCVSVCQHKHPNYQVFAQVLALIGLGPRRISIGGPAIHWGHGSLGHSSVSRPTLHVLMSSPSSPSSSSSSSWLSTNYVCAHGQASPNDPKLPTMRGPNGRKKENFCFVLYAHSFFFASSFFDLQLGQVQMSCACDMPPDTFLMTFITLSGLPCHPNPKPQPPTPNPQPKHLILAGQTKGSAMQK